MWFLKLKIMCIFCRSLNKMVPGSAFLKMGRVVWVEFCPVLCFLQARRKLASSTTIILFQEKDHTRYHPRTTAGCCVAPRTAWHPLPLPLDRKRQQSLLVHSKPSHFGHHSRLIVLSPTSAGSSSMVCLRRSVVVATA